MFILIIKISGVLSFLDFWFFLTLVSMTLGQKSVRNRVIFWKCSKKVFIIKFHVWKYVSVQNLAFKTHFEFFDSFEPPYWILWLRITPKYTPKIGHWTFFDRKGPKDLKNSKTSLSWKNALKKHLAAPLEEIN